MEREKFRCWQDMHGTGTLLGLDQGGACRGLKPSKGKRSFNARLRACTALYDIDVDVDIIVSVKPISVEIYTTVEIPT